MKSNYTPYVSHIRNNPSSTILLEGHKSTFYLSLNFGPRRLKVKTAPTQPWEIPCSDLRLATFWCMMSERTDMRYRDGICHMDTCNCVYKLVRFLKLSIVLDRQLEFFEDTLMKISQASWENYHIRILVLCGVICDQKATRA